MYKVQTMSEAQVQALIPGEIEKCHNLQQNYHLSTCNSDSSSSIFHMCHIAIVPIYMEIPFFDANGERVSQFKMMAKVIGKNGIFLKQIKQNCAEAFPNKISAASYHPDSSVPFQNLRIELTKVYSSQ